MPPSDPRSRKGPSVERGSGKLADDDEVDQGTVRRSSQSVQSVVSRGTGTSLDKDDPEKYNQTNARPALKESKPLSERKKRPGRVCLPSWVG